MLVRLQKYLADQGIASRRKAEDLIRAKKVSVNGKVAVIGQKVDPEKDKVELVSELHQVRESDTVAYLFNKPVGVTSTTRSFKGEKNILDYFPKTHRLFPAGRLDKESRGMIIVTNDGNLVHFLTHPSKYGEKEYYVTADKPITDLTMKRLRQGIKYEGIEYKVVSVRQRSQKELRFVLREGKKRHIRMMMRACGYQVRDLVRVRINELRMGVTKPGQYRKLSENDFKKLGYL